MKKTFEKLIICICIILTLMNFFVGNLSFAASTLEQELAKIEGNIGDGISKTISGVVGILTWLPRVLVIGAAGIIQSLGTSLLSMSASGSVGTGILTPEDILFDKIELTSIDFFDIPTEDGFIKSIREGIAAWYYVMRILAIAILLGILIFVGIKMAISTVASEKAVYKKALFDWATSLALIFLLHYLIRGVLWINSELVKVLAKAAEGVGLDNLISEMAKLLFSWDFITSVAAIAVYIMIMIQTLVFLINYIKRMLTLAFLIIISPLITITYSIDKMGDQKAQALNTWLKEFSYTVLVQPFHCILYLVFVSTTLKIINSGTGTLIALLFAILAIKFIWDGEKIVRKIFGFEQSSSLAAAAASGAVVGSLIGKAKSAAGTAKSGIKFAKNSKTGQLIKARHQEKKDLKGLSKDEKKDYKNAKKNDDTERMEKLRQEASKKREDKANEREKKRAERRQKGIHKIANDIKDSEVGRRVGNATKTIKNKATTFGSSDFGKALGYDVKRWTRSLVAPEKVAKFAAGAAVAAAMYALPDTDLISSVGAGYVAGKSAETGIRNLKENKKEYFEENVLKAWNRHCDIKGISGEKRTQEAFQNWYDTVYSRGKNMDEYSQKNMSKAEKEATKELAKLGLDSGDIDEIVSRIQKAILAKQDYDPSKLLAGYSDTNGNSIDAEDISNAIGDYADKFNASYVYEQASNYNDQMEKFGVKAEDSVYGITEKEFEAASTAPIREVEENDLTETETYQEFESIYQEAEKEAKDNIGESADLDDVKTEMESILTKKLKEIESNINTELSNIQSGLESETGSLIRKVEDEVSGINLNGDIESQLSGIVNSVVSEAIPRTASTTSTDNLKSTVIGYARAEAQKQFMEQLTTKMHEKNNP